MKMKVFMFFPFFLMGICLGGCGEKDEEVLEVGFLDKCNNLIDGTWMWEKTEMQDRSGTVTSTPESRGQLMTYKFSKADKKLVIIVNGKVSDEYEYEIANDPEIISDEHYDPVLRLTNDKGVTTSRWLHLSSDKFYMYNGLGVFSYFYKLNNIK